MRVTHCPPPNQFHYLLKYLPLLSITTLLFFSCAKDEIKNSSPTSFDPKYETYYRLLAFFEKTEGKSPTYPILLPRTGYSPADIRDHIEGTLNMVYSDPSLTWADYDETTDTFTIALSAGYAIEANVLAKYDQVLDSVSAFFYSIEEEDRFPFVFDVENIYSDGSVLQFSVFTQIGKIHRDPTPFGSTDYWSVFELAGHCSPMSGDTRNASDRMNEALLDYYQPYGCFFYTNPHNVPAIGDLEEYGWKTINEEDPNPGDWIIDYRTFYSKCTTGTTECEDFYDNGVYCLDPDEMNYYFQSIVSIYNDYMAEVGYNHVASNILIDHITADETEHWWAGQIRFGTVNYCIEYGEFPYMLPPCCP